MREAIVTDIRRFRNSVRKTYSLYAIVFFMPASYLCIEVYKVIRAYVSGNISLAILIFSLAILFGLLAGAATLMHGFTVFHQKYSNIEIDPDKLVLNGPFRTKKEIHWKDIIRVTPVTKNGWSLVTDSNYLQVDFRMYEFSEELAELMIEFIPDHIHLPDI